LRLKPDGRGVMVVGDDAQSIYSFRAATVRNARVIDNKGCVTGSSRTATEALQSQMESIKYVRRYHFPPHRI
jgi:superfamily I DNA/RNA helicase